MINWKLTEEKYNIKQDSKLPFVIIVNCDDCGKEQTRKISRPSHLEKVNVRCRACALNDPITKEKSRQAALKHWVNNGEKLREKLSKLTKKQWEDPEFRKKVQENSKKIWEDPIRREKMSKIRTDEDCLKRLIERNKILKPNPKKISNIVKERWVGIKSNAEVFQALKDNMSSRTKELWKNPVNREKFVCALKKTWEKDSFRSRIVESSKSLWKNKEYREKLLSIFRSEEFRLKASEIAHKLWCNESYRKKMLNNTKVSSLQITIYSILEDLNVKFYRERAHSESDPETMIGPYRFDCVVPRKDRTTLLIECQGDYWHSIPKAIIRDEQKASYIANNFPHKYEIKYLWEHEFGERDRITSTLKYWLGLDEPEKISYDFNQVIIKQCAAKEYRLLLAKYHYLSLGTRGGIAWGAFLGDVLIGVCIFSTPIRQNIHSRLGACIEEVKELSRLCIHPNYRMKNFASWFISKCVSKLSKATKLVISYCDTTYNHDGTIYKASNFTFDGEVRRDYWYISEDGWAKHKKTLYNQARSLGITEADCAKRFNYTKVYGGKKLRFIYWR
jgi:hypothetical protein